MNNSQLLKGRQRGFSLVELMVALVVGLAVVAALLATLSATSTSSKHSQAMAQMSQDASTALNMLREQLAHVGYSHVVNVDAKGKFVKAYPGGVAGYTSGPGLMGCSSAFTDAGAANIDALGCSGAGEDAIAVAYEADDKNDVSSAAGVPLDCLGNELAKVGPPANQFYLADNRFYLATPDGATHPALYCRGNGGKGSTQALVENIEEMRIRYGVAANPGVNPIQVGYYAKASSLNPGAAPLTPAYANVVSVRVCVLVVSADKVMEKVGTAYPEYRDCDDVKQKSNDAYMRRAFTSTVVLQNTLTF